MNHLLYHVYPFRRGADQVRWNVEQLLRRAHVFDGKKIITVAVGPDTLPFQDVVDMFPKDWEVLGVANDPKLWELTGWDVGWPRLEHEDGHVFRAHAKGVTRWKKHDGSPGMYGRNARDWTEMMYRVCLDHMDLVYQSLKDHPITGPFKRIGNHFYPESPSTWHYHGSFYWVRSDAKHNWTAASRRWFGVESFPGEAFPDPADGGDLFSGKEKAGRFAQRLNLYNDGDLELLKEDIRTWEQQHPPLTAVSSVLP